MEPRDYGPFPYTPINNRPKLRWPNGAQLALWVVTNVEFWSLKTNIAAHYSQKTSEAWVPGVRQWGQRDYGNRIGIFRLMEVFEKHGIRSTATTNSDVCDFHPQIIDEAVKLGWEFMGHNKTNTTWLNAVPAEEERKLIHESLARLEKATGKKPAGWLGAGLTETWNTLDYLVDEGLSYVCDWCNDDQPYLMDVNGKRLVYLPYSYELNDAAQIGHRDRSIDEFTQMIRLQFDTLYREGKDSARVMAICLHPWLIGVPHRIAGLDAALKYCCSHEGVWKATGSEIVNAYLESGSTF